MIGRTLGHYRIVEKLGAGGMGVVYKAQDTRLDRFVALKVLPPETVADPDRKRRFVQEAKAASALNHPHVVHIYDIDQSDGTDFIAMEYVEGKTLDQLIPRHGMRLNEALKCALQLADALTKAHAAGIIHRDLKPGNVMVTDEGQVKVLDFGLAKLTEAAPHSDDEPTRTVKPTTEEGTIVGTVAYMSPEQAEGRKVDARSDIFSFGAVLYEMVTGSRAFQGDTRASTLAAVLKDEPKPASQVAVGLPREVERLIRRCLRKDPARRVQHMDDVKVALEELKEESDSGALAAAGLVARPGIRWGLGVALTTAAVILAAAGWFWVSRSRVAPSETPPTAVPLTGFPGSEVSPSFSPDGSEVAFAWNGDKEDNVDIYIKQIDPPGARQRLTDSPAAESGPAWSPDGRRIAFLRQQEKGAAIVLIPSRGGAPRTLTETTVTSSFLTWTPDGKWLAFSDRASAKQESIWAIEVESGERRRLTTLQTTAQATDVAVGDYCPSFSPDGGSLAFARQIRDYIFDLYLLRLTTDLQPAGEPAQITKEHYPSVTGLTWTPDSREIVYSAGGVYSSLLWRVFASERQTPRRLLFASPSARYPAIGGTARRLVYTWSVRHEHLWRLNMRTREREALIRSTSANQLPQYSPNGRKIAFTSYQSGNPEVWTCDANGANCQQLTHIGGPQCGTPRWSPDGQWLAFDARVEEHTGIYVIAADGGEPRRVVESLPVNNTVPSWSHDGHWILFASDRSGRNEIWKVPAEGGQAEQVTRSGGFNALASPDGKYLYYARAGSIWRVPIEGGEEQQMPARVFMWANFAVTAKGVYFMPDAKTIQFLDPTTGKINTLATVDKPLGGLGAGICVSPDDAYVLWSQVDHDSSDLMLVEHFR
jgi:Tol biopolymer transport system component/predicted Ser/Thr protein kinase